MKNISALLEEQIMKRMVAENPTELKSLFHFVNENKGLRKIIVTSQTKKATYQLNEGETIQFVPSAIYAYWIVEYLFKANGMLVYKQA